MSCWALRGSSLVGSMGRKDKAPHVRTIDVLGLNIDPHFDADPPKPLKSD